MREDKIFIKLSGETGYAFHIIGEVRKLCKKKGKNFDTIHKEMTAGDYDHMIDVVKKHFDCFVFIS